MDQDIEITAPWALELLAYEKTMGKPAIGWTFDRSPECWGLLAYGLFAVVSAGFLFYGMLQDFTGA
jgi:hypothetical protein